MLAVVRPVVQLLQIQEVHPVAHSSAYNFCFFYLPVLSRPSFTSRTPNKDQKTEKLSTFGSFKSYNPEIYIHDLRSDHFVHGTQALTKSGMSWFPRMDSHDSSPIQQLLCCSIMRLERSFSIKRFQELHGIKNWKISVQPCGILHVL